MKRWAVGILIFDGVELLDFAGPYEVLASARVPEDQAGGSGQLEEFAGWREAHAPFNVFTVAKHRALVKASGGLGIQPDHHFNDHPPLDILVIPGGGGVRRIIDEPDLETLEWMCTCSKRAQLTTSVCTGAWLLAKAGLLRNRRATTHFLCLDRLTELDPTISVLRDHRIVDDDVITAAGVSAGIDMSLYIVEKLHGPAVANATAQYIEYPRVKTVHSPF